MIALLYAFLKKATKAELKKTGIQVEGIVYKQDYQPNNFAASFDRPLINDQIFIRFLTLKQEWITAPIDQEFTTFYSEQYTDGERVCVYYDKTNPSNFYISTKQSEFGGRLFIACFGLLFISIGLYIYRRIKPAANNVLKQMGLNVSRSSTAKNIPTYVPA